MRRLPADVTPPGTQAALEQGLKISLIKDVTKHFPQAWAELLALNMRCIDLLVAFRELPCKCYVDALIASAGNGPESLPGHGSTEIVKRRKMRETEASEILRRPADSPATFLPSSASKLTA